MKMAILGGVVLFIAGLLLRGWVLSVLWGWFVTPLGTPPITIPIALGLSLLISMFTQEVKREKEAITVALVSSIVISLLSLGIGAIYHAFM
jgi:hypothetical protein